MANKVKIYSTLKSGNVSFDGARVNSKEIGSLAVEAHPTLTNRIRIKSLTQFKRGSNTQYRVFFGKLNINRIQNEAGQDLVADLGMDRTAVISYIQTQITKPIVTEYFEYNPITDRLEANKNIEVKKHGFFIGGKYKMASGNSNLYYEDLASGGNSYPVMGEVLDQSVAANQVAGAGATTPKMRVFGDFQIIPLGGNPVDDTAIGYDGANFFPMNISGVGITTRIGETVTAEQQLKYEITIGGLSVYIQYLPKQALAVNQDLTWYFDHPLDIEAGTTLNAAIYKVSTVNNQEVNDGVLQVCEGDAVPTRYHATVLNRFFEDKDLELISPYLKLQAMDFSADATGSSIIMKDLTLAAGAQVLTHHAINELQAVANGSTIQIKIKDGAKILVNSLPVGGASINGVLVNSVLNTAVSALNTLFANAASFNSTGNPVSNFVLSGDDLTITLADGTSFTSDVTTLGVDTDKFVTSGAVSGSDLILTLDDGSTVTIDATNLVSGSTMSATNDRWYISYGTNANQEVGVTSMTSAVNLQAPYYFGQSLLRGSEFKFNINTGNQLRLGIWDGAEEATAYNGSPAAGDASNWGTVFSFANGSGKFTDSSNTDISTYHAGGYTATNGAAMSVRFGDDGHLTLLDISGATEVIVGKTTIALGVASFNLQFAGFNNSVFPNGIISTVDWTIVHDFAGTEAGIVNGILDHTVLQSNISIGIGEKIMFMLDEVGQGDFFGTNYTAAATGISTAEEQLVNEFSYATNETLQFEFNGTGDWNVNTNATYYFDNGAGVVGYRKGGANAIQGMFSMRFNADGKLTIYSEDNGEKVATAKADPAIGSSVHFHYGVRGNRAYYSIPTISKQAIGQGSQPSANFAPTVADQTASVRESQTLNFQVVSSDNIVNQFVELDAPSWMTMNQTTGILSGVAPAFVGGAADTIVVNCKAGNAIGGSTEFSVTVSVTSYASTNTKSLRFPNGSSAYLNGNAANVTALQRAANGAGASDAWSVSLWIKPSTSTTAQTLFYYGGDDLVNEGRIELQQFSGNNIILRYGNNAGNLNFIGVGNFPTNQWNHVLLTYSGADTLVSAGGASAFKMYINGANGISQVQATGGGYSGTIVADKFRIGRLDGSTTNQYILDGVVNQIALFETDENANVAAIYNGGATQDLSGLTSAPVHYYEIEDSETTVTDTIGSANLVGFNFTASDLVTDTP